MSSFIIEGGNELSGAVQPQGAKNEALQILCAALLTEEKVTIKNIPQIKDVTVLIELIQNLGVRVQKLDKNSYTFEANEINEVFLNSDEFFSLSSKIRGSVMLIAPLLIRLGYVCLPQLGGDKIGRRKINVHIDGLQELGAAIEYDRQDKKYYFKAQDGLLGAYIHLDEASVTGTANILMAAALSKGKSTIYNAACEPYLQQLAKMLNCMGAKIKGIGSNLLEVEGVEKLNGCEHLVAPDMIEIGSWVGLAAMTHSELTIKGVKPEHVGVLPKSFAALGVQTKFTSEGLLVPKQAQYVIETDLQGAVPTISDAPWPGLSPDLISILLVTATKAKGSVLIHQKMFESRLFFTDKLIDMGAKIILCDPHRAVVIGLEGSNLKASKMSSPDIRAGMSLLIAALAAKGKSIIQNIEQIDRGYEDIECRLQELGAKITRVS